MDVGTMNNLSSNISTIANKYTQNAGKADKAAEANAAAAEAKAAENSGKTGEAYAVDISDAAKSHGEAVKGLTSEQIDVLKEGIQKSQELMIRTLTEQNAKLQGWLDEGIGILNFDGIKVDASKFALPAVGTTPEEAAAAVAEGGDYSVDAVATRIFDLASAIAGGDPEKLKKMQTAVEEGFKQAGLAWKDAMGQDEMPQITKDTHAEITKRFDDLYAKLTGAKPDEGEKAADKAEL